MVLVNVVSPPNTVKSEATLGLGQCQVWLVLMTLPKEELSHHRRAIRVLPFITVADISTNYRSPAWLQPSPAHLFHRDAINNPVPIWHCRKKLTNDLKSVTDVKTIKWNRTEVTRGEGEVKMVARKGLLAPQNTFLDTIAARFDGTREYLQ